MLGRYVLLETLGEGGSGQVFAAYDSALERKIALKVLRSDRSSAALVREGRLLASLSHPSIISVHDVGESEDGRTYLTMELASQGDAGRWCATQPRISWRSLLTALTDAGKGLAAAHRHGIVHGDIKPSNLLVHTSGRIAIGDFGIARLVQGEQTDDGAFGVTGKPRPGTPAFMAPEQRNGRTPDARSDQFSFCLTVWVLLFSERPNVPALSPALDSDEQLAAVSDDVRLPNQPRATTTWSVPRRIRRALERGLAADPDARWPDVDTLLRELSREPAGIRRASVSAVAVAALSGGAWLVGAQSREPCRGSTEALADTWDGDSRAELVEAMGSVPLPYADTEAARVADELDAYADAWAVSHREVCEATTVRGEQSASMMDLQMACLHRRRNAFAAAVEVLRHADVIVLRNAERVVSGLVPVQTCLDLERLRADAPVPPAADVAAEVETVRTEVARAHSLERAGAYPHALEVASAAVRRAEVTGYAPLLAEAQLQLGQLHLQASDSDAARSALETAMELGLEHGPMTVGIDAASVLGYWAAQVAEDEALAQAYLRMATSLVRKHAPSGSTHAGVLTNLGVVDARAGRFERAREHFMAAHDLLQGVLGSDHPRVLDMLDNIASVHMEMRDMQRAEELFREVLARRRAALGMRHPSTILELSNLGQVLQQLGRPDEAQAIYEEALALTTATLGPDVPDVAHIERGLAHVAMGRGEFEQARRHAERSLTVLRKLHHPGHSLIADALLTVGDIHYRTGQHERARDLYLEALEISRAALAPTHPQVAVTLQKVGLAYIALQQWADAERELTAAIDTFIETGVEPYTRVVCLQQRGVAKAEQGRPRQALEDLREAARIQEAHEGPPSMDDALTYNLLGQVAKQLGRRDEAIEAYKRTLTLGEEIELVPEDMSEARAALAALGKSESSR